jgi:hypothetical protein
MDGWAYLFLDCVQEQAVQKSEMQVELDKDDSAVNSQLSFHCPLEGKIIVFMRKKPT